MYSVYIFMDMRGDKMETKDLNKTHLNELCAYIINGGSPLDLCDKWGVAWDELWLWLQADRDRSTMYDKAVHAQNEWAIARILKEIRLLAFSDHRAMYDENKRLLHPTAWSKEVGAVVQSYKVTEYFEGSGRDKEQVGWTTEVKMYDKQKAIELYGKYLKLFGDRVTVDGSLSLEELVDASNDSRATMRLPGLGVN
jgi:hypothetical protein